MDEIGETLWATARAARRALEDAIKPADAAYPPILRLLDAYSQALANAVAYDQLGKAARAVLDTQEVLRKNLIY